MDAAAVSEEGEEDEDSEVEGDEILDEEDTSPLRILDNSDSIISRTSPPTNDAQADNLDRSTLWKLNLKNIRETNREL